MLSTKDAIQLCTSIRASAREATTNRADCRWECGRAGAAGCGGAGVWAGGCCRAQAGGGGA